MAVSMAMWIDTLLNNQEDEVYDRLRAEELIPGDKTLFKNKKGKTLCTISEVYLTKF